MTGFSFKWRPGRYALVLAAVVLGAGAAVGASGGVAVASGVFEPDVLGGVSCTSASNCIATGYSSTFKVGQFSLAEKWDGSSWSVLPTPNPAGSTQSRLGGVSCTSPSACTAVGSYTNSSGVIVTLAEAWNGSSWSIEPTPNPGGTTDSELSAVSCTSPSACTAIGRYQPGSNSFGTLAESWNGTSWSIEPTPNPGGTDGALEGVSCTSASACTAVGGYFNTVGTVVPLAESWNGSAWSIQSTPSPDPTSNIDGYSTLNGVSCTSASSCTATGSYRAGSSKTSLGTEVTLAEHWNGTSWSIQPTPKVPNPSGGTVIMSELDVVSCTSASACIAIGHYQLQSGDTLELPEAWNGSAWAIQAAPPLPNGDFDPVMAEVSCTSASACTAVGMQGTVGDVFGDVSNLTLAEAWNGAAWAVQSTPSP